MTYNAPISTLFKPLYTSGKRYFIITGGRGSLKSTSVHDFVTRLTYEEGHGVLFTRYTMTSASKSIIPEFVQTLKKLGVEHQFTVTNEKVINNITKSFVLFSGIKSGSKSNTGRLKSIQGITTWVVEEGEDFQDAKEFRTIDDSIRTTSKQNRVIWIQNPTTKEHFIHKKFFKKSIKRKIKGYDVTMSNHEMVEHIHTTYHIAEDQGFLDKTWLQNKDIVYQEMINSVNKFVKDCNSGILKKTKEEIEIGVYSIMHESEYYYNYIGGWLEREENAVFKNWKEGKFIDTGYSGIGLDYGMFPDPLAAIQISIDRKEKKIYLKQKVYGTNIEDVQNAFIGAGIDKRTIIKADSSENRTTKDLKRKGYNISSVRKQSGDIAADIREIKKYILIVDPESDDLKTELNNYMWNDRKASVPIDSFNHLLDAFRYIFKQLVHGGKRKGVTRSN